MFFYRELMENDEAWVRGPPGRHYIPDHVVRLLLAIDSTLGAAFRLSFGSDWQSDLGIVQHGHERTLFLPTKAVRVQNELPVDDAAGDSPRRLRQRKEGTRSSSNSSLSHMYDIRDMFCVIEKLESNEGLLAAALGQEQTDEALYDKAFLDFVDGLDTAVTGPGAGRVVNCAAICSETLDAWEENKYACVLDTARDFVALGYLSGDSWPECDLSSRGYTRPERRGRSASSSKSPASSSLPWSSPRQRRSSDSSDSSDDKKWMSSPVAHDPTAAHWRSLPHEFKPDFILNQTDGLRVAMLVEILLAEDARGQRDDETDKKYETYLLERIFGAYHGTGQVRPVNLARGKRGRNGALLSLEDVRRFMDAVYEGSSGAEVTCVCRAAATKRRAASLAEDGFPFPSIPPTATMLQGLRAMTQALESLKPVDEGNSGAEDSGASFSGRGEVFSAERMAYANYLKIECGVSMEKLPMVLALTHLFWLGEEPRADQLPSVRTCDAAFQQLEGMEDYICAQLVHYTLKHRPDTMVSYSFDATKNKKGEQINNLIMTVALLNPDEYVRGEHALPMSELTRLTRLCPSSTKTQREMGTLWRWRQSATF